MDGGWSPSSTTCAHASAITRPRAAGSHRAPFISRHPRALLLQVNEWRVSFDKKPQRTAFARAVADLCLDGRYDELMEKYGLGLKPVSCEALSS